MMKVLELAEVEDIVAMAKGVPESQLIAILDKWEEKHPEVYRIIYGEPSDAIANVNKDMANLYLDLSFDVLWVFGQRFGEAPEIDDEDRWVSSRLSLIDMELKSITKEFPMDSKIRGNLQERFVKSSLESSMQLGLLEYLGGRVMNYVSFDHKRAAASQLTNNLLFVLVRLVGDLYHSQTQTPS